jgi:hypothetical protein
MQNLMVVQLLQLIVLFMLWMYLARLLKEIASLRAQLERDMRPAENDRNEENNSGL